MKNPPAKPLTKASVTDLLFRLVVKDILSDDYDRADRAVEWLINNGLSQHFRKLLDGFSISNGQLFAGKYLEGEAGYGPVTIYSLWRIIANAPEDLLAEYRFSKNEVTSVLLFPIWVGNTVNDIGTSDNDQTNDEYDIDYQPIHPDIPSETRGIQSTPNESDDHLSTDEKFIFNESTSHCCLFQLESSHRSSVRRDFGRVPSDLWKFPFLKQIIIHSESLVDLPVDLEKCTALRNLELFCSGLGTIPPVIFKLTQLENLVASGCGLKKVPDFLFDMKNLKTLNLSDNFLSEFSIPHFEHRIDFSIPYLMKTLRSLSLSKNKLTEFPRQLCEWPALEKLWLCGNEIRVFPEEIATSCKIGYLSIGSYLKKLPDSISQWQGLRYIDFSGNKELEEVSVELCRLPLLEKISFSGCRRLLRRGFQNYHLKKNRGIERLEKLLIIK